MQIVMARGRNIPVETRKRPLGRTIGVKPTSPARIEAEKHFQLKPIAAEGEFATALRFIKEGDIKRAAQIAARLINRDDDGGFFIYGGTSAFADVREWFEDQIAGAESEQAGFVTLTPQLAQVLLLNNKGNRRVNSSNLEDIMRDIVADLWAINGEAIIVSKDGKLNDGQHRCFSVLLTGKPIRTAISFGVERDTIGTVDIGRKRTGSDRLGISGVKNSVPLAALATLVFEMKNKRKPTAAEIDAYYADHEAEIGIANGVCGTNMKGVGLSPMGAAAFYLVQHGYSADEVRDFYSAIRSGEMLAKRDPRMILHKAIYVTKIKLSRDNWVAAFVEHFMTLKKRKTMTMPSYSMTLDWS